MLPQVSNVISITMPHFPNAVCRDVEPEIFFPTEFGAGAEEAIWTAKEFCFSCTHRVDCLKFALKEDITHGVWGGFSATERKSINGKRFKPRSDLGAKSLELRNEGLRMREIAAKLASSPTAVSKAISRHLESLEASK
jgi:hypothetical protein